MRSGIMNIIVAAYVKLIGLRPPHKQNTPNRNNSRISKKEDKGGGSRLGFGLQLRLRHRTPNRMDPSGAFNNSELQDLIEQEKQRAMANEMVAKLTSVCWDKCITGTPGSKFSSSEASCLTNCAQRYLDLSVMIAKRLQSMSQGQGFRG
ncbi:Mitochondrial import inner membrane translocase subunit TIM8-like protein [Drosera capensis]